MTNHSLATSLTRDLLAVRNGGPAIAPGSVEALLDAETAYAVQAAVASKSGPVGGFKTARKPGQPAIMAPIFQKDILRSPAHFDTGRFGLIGIELEIGFFVLRDRPVRRTFAPGCATAWPPPP